MREVNALLLLALMPIIAIILLLGTILLMLGGWCYRIVDFWQETSEDLR